MSKIINPYERIEKIKEELAPLEIQEKALMNNKKAVYELERIQSHIFFLVIEEMHIQNTINWFEKKKRGVEFTE